MRARLILEGTPEEGVHPVVAEVVEVTTESGERLDVAAWAVPSRVVVSQHLGRAAEGHPLFVYTRDPLEGA